jgi:hypothetical protein
MGEFQLMEFPREIMSKKEKKRELNFRRQEKRDSIIFKN